MGSWFRNYRKLGPSHFNQSCREINGLIVGPAHGNVLVTFPLSTVNQEGEELCLMSLSVAGACFAQAFFAFVLTSDGDQPNLLAPHFDLKLITRL